MNIINPYYQVNNDNGIFDIRQKDYDKLLNTVTEILEPVKSLGFEITELNLKDSRISSNELSKTIKQTLTIQLQKGISKIDFTMFVPKLIDNNYIMINGRKKIPLFQLIDTPIVTRGDSIKLITNISTIMLYKDKTPPYIKMSFLGKKIPFALMMYAYYDSTIIINKYDPENLNIDPEAKDLYNLFLSDLQLFCKESPGYTQDDFILELGRTYSRYNAKSKGEDIIHALDLIPKIDIFTAKFLTQPTIMEELVEALKIQFVDDTLFTNKRVRCFEYMIYSKLIKNVFDLCYANRTSRQAKFNINTNQIIMGCNVSDIIQFDFSINPIEELTKLSRISLLGPGGFKRETIPSHLRDICPSMFGRICPVDTPDRDNCGVLQNLVPNVRLDNNLKFTSDYDPSPISIPISMVPFLEHDDQTRLQMASSQMRQSIMLKKFDTPMISSGCEGLFSQYTQFVKIAKYDGEVLFIDRKYLIVQYTTGEIEIFNISYRKIYIEHIDFMHIYVKDGDKFKKGEVLAESNFCNKAKINFGKNLLTGVMIHYGNNYEDAMIISDRLVNDDVLTSVHYRDLSFKISPNQVLLSLEKNQYKPLPNEFDIIQAGAPYANIQNLTCDNLYSSFQETKILEAEKKFIISEINIYANQWNTDIPEFGSWVEEQLFKQQETENYLKKIIKDKLPSKESEKFIKENNLDLFSLVGKYKNKKEKIDGLYIEMFGVYFRKIKVGDKLGNRHGNKGVVSQIVKHSSMPQLKDGRHLDICINPLGIISRMNLGQLYELHLSIALEGIKNKITEMINNKTQQSQIKEYLLNFIKIIDITKNNWYYKQFEEQLPENIDLKFVQELYLIQPPFESVKIEDLDKALKYSANLFKQELYDPVSKTFLANPISVGYMYFFRMVHIAEEKTSARGIGTYAKRTLQPLKGKKHNGGQRIGEMEMACFIGHDAPQNLFEFFTTKSDCIDLKKQYIRNLVEFDLENEKNKMDIMPESVKLLNSYLTVLGVDYH